jgi:hypothetical protein
VIDARKLKVGDKLHNNSEFLHGHVDMVTGEGNYVRVVWQGSRRADIIARTSPLWNLLELKT